MSNIYCWFIIYNTENKEFGESGDISFYFKHYNKDPDFIGSCPNQLWSHHCQKVSINKIINGMIYVCPTKLIFQDEHKSTVIQGDDIECVFWRWTFHQPDSVSIFTSDFKGFI